MLTDQQLQQLLAARDLAEFQRLLASFDATLEQVEFLTHEISLEPEQRALANQVVGHYDTLNTPEARQAIADQEASLSAIDAAEQAGQISTEQAATERGVLTGDLDARLRWVYESVGILTETQKAQILAEARVQDGAPANTFEELISSGYFDMGPTDPYGNPTRAAQIINDVILDAEPAPAHLVNLDGGRRFAVPDANYRAAAAAWSMTPTALNRIVRLADRSGLRFGPSNEIVYWQPMVMMLRMFGAYDDWLSASANRTVGTGVNPATGEPTGLPVTREGRNEPEDVTVTRQSTDRPVVLGGRMAMEEGNAVIPNLSLTLNASEMAAEFREGFDRYGDSGLALLYTFDPALAARVSQALRETGSTAGLSRADRNAVMDVLGKATGDGDPTTTRTVLLDTGFSRAAGLDTDDAFQAFLAEQAVAEDGGSGGGGRGGSGGAAQAPTVVLPDPAALNETFRNLYREMFLEEPSEQQLADFRSQINAATTMAQTAQPGSTVTNVSPEARAMDVLRGDPRYTELYGNKPEGMSEADYRAQFEAAQQDMLGNERAGNVALLAGLRSGRYQTAVGAAAATPEAWNNSRFLGRLARAGQIVGAVT